MLPPYPPLFALGAQIIPASATSSGVGAYNGIGNLLGAPSPSLVGWSVGQLQYRFDGFDLGRRCWCLRNLVTDPPVLAAAAADE